MIPYHIISGDIKFFCKRKLRVIKEIGPKAYVGSGIERDLVRRATGISSKVYCSELEDAKIL